MRHNKSFNHLGRKSAHRGAMLSNMAVSLIMNKRINTTVAKAKALRMYVEPILTKAKEDTTHSRRIVFSMLQDKTAVTELFREVSAKVADRPGGYTRIIKLGNRLGDNADMAMIELVDYNEILLGGSAAKKAKTARRRKTAKKKTEEEVSAEVKGEKPVKVAKVTKESATEEKNETSNAEAVDSSVIAEENADETVQK